MPSDSLSPYIGRYANFRRVESGNTKRLVYRQDTGLVVRVIAAGGLVLGVAVLIELSRMRFGIFDSQRLTVFSVAFQLFLGVMLVSIGIRNAFEASTITFDKADSSVRFVRSILLPMDRATATLTSFDSVTVRPSIWGGGVLFWCVYLTGMDEGIEFGVFADPDRATAKQKANELSLFLGLTLDSADA